MRKLYSNYREHQQRVVLALYSCQGFRLRRVDKQASFPRLVSPLRSRASLSSNGVLLCAVIQKSATYSMSFPVIHGVEVAMPPPEGYQVNFDNPVTDGMTIKQAYWIFAFEFVIATAFLAQRIYTNAILLRKVLPDDCMFNEL